MIDTIFEQVATSRLADFPRSRLVGKDRQIACLGSLASSRGCPRERAMATMARSRGILVMRPTIPGMLSGGLSQQDASVAKVRQPACCDLLEDIVDHLGAEESAATRER